MYIDFLCTRAVDGPCVVYSDFRMLCVGFACGTANSPRPSSSYCEVLQHLDARPRIEFDLFEAIQKLEVQLDAAMSQA